MQTEAKARELREGMVRDGYVQIDGWSNAAWLKDLSAKFCAAIDALDAVGLPAVFLLVFDEVCEYRTLASS